MDLQKLSEGIHDCSCGMDHRCPIDHIIVGSGVLDSLNDICKEYNHILLVADQNTFRVCGADVKKILGAKAATEVIFETGDAPLIPDEEAIAQMEAQVTEKTDLVLGVGSGVINDLCKIVSFNHNLPSYIVATAPSMDGYASVGSALILKGMKVTLNAKPPKAIIADTKVLKDAPMDMLQAGFGDIIGKYSCLNDWKLAVLVRGEFFCQDIYDMVYDTVVRVRGLAEGIRNREEEAVGALMEALVVVGVAMSYVGNSRPASGSEHHFSHYFEITGILTGQPYLAHGIDVFYSAAATAAMRERMVKAMPEKRAFDRTAWEAEIRRIYLSSADEVIALQDKLGWYTKDDSAVVLEKWPEIKTLLEEVPTEQEMKEMLTSVGLDYNEFVKVYGQKKIDDAALYAKDLKDRYTVLWLYYDFFRA